jgi:hypothetical protein
MRLISLGGRVRGGRCEADAHPPDRGTRCGGQRGRAGHARHAPATLTGENFRLNSYPQLAYDRANEKLTVVVRRPQRSVRRRRRRACAVGSAPSAAIRPSRPPQPPSPAPNRRRPATTAGTTAADRARSFALSMGSHRPARDPADTGLPDPPHGQPSPAPATVTTSGRRPPPHRPAAGLHAPPAAHRTNETPQHSRRRSSRTQNRRTNLTRFLVQLTDHHNHGSPSPTSTHAEGFTVRTNPVNCGSFGGMIAARRGGTGEDGWVGACRGNGT